MEYVQWFCDEQGNPDKHPNVPVWPEKILTRVRFASEEEGSRATLTWAPHGEASPEEIQAFVDMRAGMHQGWTEAFDKLESCLS